MLLEACQYHGKCIELCHSVADWCCRGLMVLLVANKSSPMFFECCHNRADRHQAVLGCLEGDSLVIKSRRQKFVDGVKSTQDAKCLSRYCQLQVQITPVPDVM
jgi:hypothetical protein